MNFDVFIVAGGGGGGTPAAGQGSGGGGAGGVYQVAHTAPIGDYTVQVGGGGPSGVNGGDSAIFGITNWIYGGGAGGSTTGATGNGANGGSGGGGTGNYGGWGGGAGTPAQGYNGGNALFGGNLNEGGGGGGIAGAGGNGYENPGDLRPLGGVGGAGYYNDFSGVSMPYAGGGGGGGGRFGGGNTGGSGSNITGGNGGTGTQTPGGNYPPNAGQPYTGGGGGGGTENYAGAPGGSGITMIRYPAPYPPDAVLVNGGTIANLANGYRLHTFYASGTLSIVAPTLSSATPASGFQGLSVTIRLLGANFTSGSTFSVDGIPVTYFAVGASNWADAILAIPAGAALGVYPMRFTNEAGPANLLYFEVKSSGSGMFLVVPTRPMG